MENKSRKFEIKHLVGEAEERLIKIENYTYEVRNLLIKIENALSDDKFNNNLNFTPIAVGKIIERLKEKHSIVPFIRVVGNEMNYDIWMIINNRSYDFSLCVSSNNLEKELDKRIEHYKKNPI